MDTVGRRDKSPVQIMNAQEEQHVQLLAIFHYIVGGLTALFACFPLVHLIIGLVMVFGGFSGSQAPPAFVGWLFIVLGGGFFLWGKVSRFASSSQEDFWPNANVISSFLLWPVANVSSCHSARCWACLRSFCSRENR